MARDRVPEGALNEGRVTGVRLGLTSISVKMEIRPTEGRERVLGAVRAFFPDLRLSDDPGGVTGQGKEAKSFREGVRQSFIADAVASDMLAGGAMRSDSWVTVFHLNKQAAMVGKLHLGTGTPAMGDVEVRMEFDRYPSREELVDWLLDRGEGTETIDPGV